MSTKKLTVLSISTAMQVLAMLACMLLPTAKLSMLFVASLLNGILCSAGYKKGLVLLSFVATSSLAIILIPNYIIPVSYILFFGGYGVMHFASISKTPVIKHVIRFGYLIISISALYFIFKALFLESVLFAVPYIYFLPVGIIIGYIIYQILYDMIIKEFYRHKYLADLIID